MQPFGNFLPYYNPYSAGSSDFLGQLGDHGFPSTPFLDAQPWNKSPVSFNLFANPAAFSDGYPFGPAFSSLSDRFRPQQQFWSNRDPEPLWSRGVSSPCFRHDHHLILRNGRPPFSIGNWEIDWRHMIEIQFDQFGVASHCRSTWRRMGPWRADRYKFSIEEANSKLQMEIMMLMSRLGIDPNDRLGNARQPFDGMVPPVVNWKWI